jgi:membrane associated rhomboid family serine protease
MLDAPSVAHGQVWRLVTYAFCHQDPFSLVFDMLLLWFLGRRLERMYGSREFLLYYLGSSFAAGTLFAAIGLTAILPTPLCGAAPAIMAIFALYALHFPREEILVFFLVPVQIFILVIIYIGVDIYSVLRAVQGEIGWEMAAHTAAHLCGAVFAFLYKHYDWHLSGIWQRITGIRTAWKRATARRRLKVYTPAPEVDQLDGKLDAILAKIHEQGSESLTDSERAVLARASERYKKR